MHPIAEPRGFAAESAAWLLALTARSLERGDPQAAAAALRRARTETALSGSSSDIARLQLASLHLGVARGAPLDELRAAATHLAATAAAPFAWQARRLLAHAERRAEGKTAAPDCSLDRSAPVPSGPLHAPEDPMHSAPPPPPATLPTASEPSRTPPPAPPVPREEPFAAVDANARPAASPPPVPAAGGPRSLEARRPGEDQSADRSLLRHLVDREIEAADRNGPDALVDLGTSLLEIGEPAQARRVFEHAIAFPGTRPGATEGLLRALLALDQPQEAALLLAVALRMHADDASAVRGLQGWRPAIEAAARDGAGPAPARPLREPPQ